MHRFLAPVIICALVLALGDSAYAQTTVDLRSPATEVVTWIAGALGTALTALSAVGIRFVFAKFGLANSQYEQNLNDRLNDIIHKGIDFALATATAEVQKQGSGLEAVKFDNYFMSVAASYIAPRAADILKKFTISQGRLEEMIWARIPAYAQVVPITGGASTPDTVKAVSKELGRPVATPAKQPDPVVVTVPTDKAKDLPDPRGVVERTTSGS
ncbi:MAG TPA: hypothetical protein VMT30_02780 [Candidatus Saccharimonadia bacterium]|nr:hypothetical protein [Candidatus Saccharimonadia bacterium]